jgi:hypothetical protein
MVWSDGGLDLPDNFNMKQGISVISNKLGVFLKYFNIGRGISVISEEYRGIFAIFPKIFYGEDYAIKFPDWVTLIPITLSTSMSI